MIQKVAIGAVGLLTSIGLGWQVAISSEVGDNTTHREVAESHKTVQKVEKISEKVNTLEINQRVNQATNDAAHRAILKAIEAEKE